MDLIKTKNDEDYPDFVKLICNMVIDKYSYTARITRLYEMLKYLLHIEEYQALDVKNIQNGTFDAYLMDRCVDWQSGKQVNFKEIYDAMLVNGDFTYSEKLLFTTSNIENVLWGIFIAVNSPEKKFEIN